VERIDRVVRRTLDRDAERLVEFSPTLRTTRDLFYNFFKECVYTDVRIQHKNKRAKECVVFLYEFFEEFFSGNHDLLPQHIQGELDARPPWWQIYLAASGVAPGAVVTDATSWTDPVNVAIACRFAAADVVADLTDREALAAAKALDETESTSGLEALDRILATFPNKRQADLDRQREYATRQELLGLFPVAGN
jgi:hypothetical protein